MVADAFGLDTVLKEAGEQSASPLHKVNVERHAVHWLQCNLRGVCQQQSCSFDPVLNGELNVRSS